MLYKGDFNWQGQCFTLYTHAGGEWQAFRNFCYQMAKKVGYSWGFVRDYFSSGADNHLITKVKGGDRDES